MPRFRGLPAFLLAALLALLVSTALIWLPAEPAQAIGPEEGTCQDPVVCSPTCPCDTLCTDSSGTLTTCGEFGAACVSPGSEPTGGICKLEGETCLFDEDCCQAMLCLPADFMTVSVCTR